MLHSRDTRHHSQLDARERRGNLAAIGRTQTIRMAKEIDQVHNVGAIDGDGILTVVSEIRKGLSLP